jgi:hypothetical protein
MKGIAQYKEMGDEITSLLNYDIKSDLHKFCDYFLEKHGAEYGNYLLNEYKKRKGIEND